MGSQGDGDAARHSGEKTNENERATEPTDDVASRGTELYASSGPFYFGPFSAPNSSSRPTNDVFPLFLAIFTCIVIHR